MSDHVAVTLRSYSIKIYQVANLF